MQDGKREESIAAWLGGLEPQVNARRDGTVSEEGKTSLARCRKGRRGKRVSRGCIVLRERKGLLYLEQEQWTRIVVRYLVA